MRPVYRTRWAVWCLIAAAMGCSLSAILLRGGAVEWFLLAVMSGIVLVSGLVPALAAAGITLTRSRPDFQRIDDGATEVRMTLRRSLPIPFVWIAIQDEAVNESAIRSNVTRFQTVMAPMVQEELAVTYTLRQLSRGLHRFKPVTITIGDWLGLTAIRLRSTADGEFLVLPPMRSLAEEQKDALPIYSLPESTDSKLHQQSDTADTDTAISGSDWPSEATQPGIGPDTRPYREGDPLRHLDFRAAAKGLGLHTKTYATEHAAQSLIVIDHYASAYRGDDRLFDACIGQAAIAAQAAARQGFAVEISAGNISCTLPASYESEFQPRLTELLQQLALLRAVGEAEGARGQGKPREQADVTERSGKQAVIVIGRDKANNGRARVDDALFDSIMQSRLASSRGGYLQVFTGDWQSGHRWSELAASTAELGCQIELIIATQNSVPSFAMREQHKTLEHSNIKVKWMHLAASDYVLPYAVEGADAHAYA